MEIVAEIGSVHDGSFGNALKLIELVADAGATVAKFQYHIPEFESVRNAPSPSYFSGEERFQYFKRTQFEVEEWIQIKNHCHKFNLKFGCSVFSIESIEALLDIGVDIIKIPSGEVTNLPLLREIRENCELIPVHISSGMSTWKELDFAIELLNDIDLSVFQCTSSYPTHPEQIGLNNIPIMISKYGLPVGLSDHSLGIEMSIAAVALGAELIEKHITFSRRMYGSDAFNALEPSEFTNMCSSIRNVYRAVKSPYDKNSAVELKEMRKTFQKGTYARKPIKKGAPILFGDLLFLKPEAGVPAKNVDDVVGKVATRDIQELEPIQLSDIL